MTPDEEVKYHLDIAAKEQQKAADALREQAKLLEDQADAAEQGKVGGEASSSSWNPFS